MSDEQEMTTIKQLLQLVDGVRKRQAAGEFTIDPGSAVDRVDERLEGFYKSQFLVDRAISAAISHWHAVWENLLNDGRGYVHTYYAMARPAIENAAAVYWMLSPDSDKERLYRVLLFKWADLDEERKAFNVTGQSDGADHCIERQDAIRAIADAEGVPLKKRPNLGYTDMVKSVPRDPHMSSVELIWRVTSGMAHGKWWAFSHLSASQAVTEGEGVKTASFSLDLEQLKVCVGVGVYTLQQAVAMYDQRRTSAIFVPGR